MDETAPRHDAAAHTRDRAGDAPRRPLGLKDGLDDDAASAVDAGDASSWAIPYTDLTMLLLVFFVIMLSKAEPSSTQSETSKTSANWYAASLQPALSCPDASFEQSALLTGDSILTGDGVLNGDGVLPGEGVLPEEGFSPIDAPRGDGGPMEEDRLADDAPPPELATAGDVELAAEWARRIDELEQSAAAFLERNDLQAAVELVATETGIEFRMSDDILFQSGAATLEERGADLMDRLAPHLRGVEGAIDVSGHTDNVPIRTARFPSNWELSAARAIAVVQRLRDLGVPETMMKAVGYGANRPIASNEDPDGRSRNRRVTIGIAPQIPRG